MSPRVGSFDAGYGAGCPALYNPVINALAKYSSCAVMPAAQA